MLKRFCWLAACLAVALPVALGGCELQSDCQRACDNTSQVCAQQFSDQGIQWDVTACTDECVANTAKCANQDLIATCISEAKTCSDIAECPACEPL